jgi:small-conductance mechanosensitive channel
MDLMNFDWNMELLVTGNYSLKLSQVIIATVILAVTYVFSRTLRAAFKRLAARRRVAAASQIYVAGRFLHYGVITIGLVFVGSSLGISMRNLVLVVSALGIGIGLGLQGIVNNFVSGLVILLEKTLKVGDFIELSNGIVGEVIEVYMRASLIRTNDNVDILVPNSELVNEMVTNWTFAEASRRFRIPFAVAYGSDKERVKKAALEAADQVDCTLQTENKEPVVWMTVFGDSSLNFVLGVWVDNEYVKRPAALASEYLWAIDDALRKYNIEIPFPQRDLHLRSSELESKVTNHNIQPRNQ